MNYYSFILTGLCLLAIGDCCAAKPIEIPNGDLASMDNATGYPHQWVRREWSTGASVPADLSVGGENGLVWLQVPAQAHGGVGWESPQVPVETLRNGFKIQFKTKASADYKGNKPWVFVAWYTGPTFLKVKKEMTDLKSSNTADDWVAEEWSLDASDIPKGATGMTIVFATIAIDGASEHSGMIDYSSLSMSEP